MERMPKLTARKVQTLTAPGLHGDGNGLYLRIGKQGGRSWILRTVVHGRRRDLGLGSASLVNLAEAREKAQEYRKVARQGGDPDTLRNRRYITFEEAVSQVHDNLLPTWRSSRHGQIWLSSIRRYAFPVLKDRPIQTIGTADILQVLTPIWASKHDTANRVKQRLALIFDWAKGAGHYPQENPVNGIKKALPNVKVHVEHMNSLPWRELPGFVKELRNREGVSARALEFIILTATRSGEARNARWSEISGDTWTIPAERMKTGKAHRVPLSQDALTVLEKVRDLDSDWIFPSPSKGRNGHIKPLSDNVFRALMRRMNVEGITTHGFRSTFRDWCSEYAAIDREVAEAALSHSLGNKVERAYARSDLFERREVVMTSWAKFLRGKSKNVLQLAAG